MLILTFSIALSTLASALAQFGLLEGYASDLASGLEAAIIAPRLQLRTDMHERLLIVGDNSVEVSGASFPSDIQCLFDDLGAFIRFLQTHLPASITTILSKLLAPKLVDTLISKRLSSAVPEELGALQEFNGTREQVHRFAETLGLYGWPGEDQLRVWSSTIPQVWLQKRQNTSLNNVRKLLKRGYGDIKTVERVETQLVSQQDHLFAGNASNEDWDAGWSGEEESNPVEKQSKHHNAAGQMAGKT